MPLYTQDEAREVLRTEYFDKVDTIYMRVEHVARSNESRDIVPIVVIDNEPRNIAWLLLEAGFGARPRRQYGHGTVRVEGLGMDMCFWLASHISQTLYRDDYRIIYKGF